MSAQALYLCFCKGGAGIGKHLVLPSIGSPPPAEHSSVDALGITGLVFI
jgi:hypothetical protein